MNSPFQQPTKPTVLRKRKDTMTWKIQKTSEATSCYPIKQKCALKSTTTNFYTNSTQDFSPDTAALDTGAIQNVLSEAKLRRILTAHAAALLKELPAAEFHRPNRRRQNCASDKTSTTTLLH